MHRPIMGTWPVHTRIQKQLHNLSNSPVRNAGKRKFISLISKRSIYFVAENTAAEREIKHQNPSRMILLHALVDINGHFRALIDLA
jgi:hypothetical protein